MMKGVTESYAGDIAQDYYIDRGANGGVQHRREPKSTWLVSYLSSCLGSYGSTASNTIGVTREANAANLFLMQYSVWELTNDSAL